MANSPFLTMRVSQDDLDRLDEVVRLRVDTTPGALGASRMKSTLAREALRIGLQALLAKNP